MSDDLRVEMPEQNSPLPHPDPMEELFGPGSGTRIVGNTDESVPDEILRVLDENQLSRKNFTSTLRVCPSGIEPNEANSAFVKAWTRMVPSIEWIARNYGPGDYFLTMRWRGKEDGDSKTKNLSETIPICISNKIMDEYKTNVLDKKIKNASDMKEKVTQNLIEQRLENEALKGLISDESKPHLDPMEAGKKFVEQTMESAKLLGLGREGEHKVRPDPNPIPWDKILTGLAPIAAAVLTAVMNTRAARESTMEKLMMLMMTQGSKNTEQMMQVMQMQAGVGSGNLAIKEFKDMVLGALDIKDALAGQAKETLADKIFKMVEAVAPQILQIAALSAQARLNNPMVKAAKGYVENNPDFQALKNDPEELKAFCERMDATYGWEQTDHILTTLGWQRPPNVGRNPARRFAAGDPRNGESEEDITSSVEGN